MLNCGARDMGRLLLLCLLGLVWCFENTEVTRVISILANGQVVLDISIRCYSSLTDETRYVYLVGPNRTLALLLARDAKNRPLVVRPREAGFIIDIGPARMEEDARSFFFHVTEFLVDALVSLPSFVNVQEPDAVNDDGRLVHSDSEGDPIMLGMSLVQSCVLFSSYVTVSESLELRLGGLVLSVESAPGKHHPWRLRGGALLFGPFRSVLPRTFEPVRVAFVNPTPLLTAESLTRRCVSGTFAVWCTDVWALVNESPKPEPMRRNCSLCPGRLASLHISLPLDASVPEFQDRLGPFAPYKCESLAKSRECEFFPRYPLLGSTRALFEVRYSLSAVDQVDLFVPIKEVGLIRKLSSNGKELRNVVPAHLLAGDKMSVLKDSPWHEHFMNKLMKLFFR